MWAGRCVLLLGRVVAKLGVGSAGLWQTTGAQLSQLLTTSGCEELGRLLVSGGACFELWFTTISLATIVISHFLNLLHVFASFCLFLSLSCSSLSVYLFR